jgi:glucose/mannose transport system substrate-binding protein
MKGLERVLTCALLTTLIGCSDDGDDGAQPPGDVVEIFSWWVDPGEFEALEALLNVHTENHPNSTIINVVQRGGGTAARETLEMRMRAGDPPDTFQSNFGLALQNWLDLDGQETIAPIDGVLGDEDWAAYPPRLLEDVSANGAIYGVPLNVHRDNSLFYNVHVFEQNGLEPPTTWEEFYEVGDALLALDPPIVPLAVGSEAAWTVNLLMFENLLIAQAGPEYYEAFFGGQASPDDPEILALLEEMLKLWNGYVNEDADALGWEAAVQLVGQGQAAMTVMGDWAKGSLMSHGLEPGVDFEQVPTIGTAGAFVFTGDCFPLPLGAKNQTGAEELLRTFGSAEAQHEFNLVKGSIPARLDVDISDFDSEALGTRNDFASDDVVKLSAVSAVVPVVFYDAVVGAIPEMLETNDPEPVLAAMRDNYELLAN